MNRRPHQGNEPRSVRVDVQGSLGVDVVSRGDGFDAPRPLTPTHFPEPLPKSGFAHRDPEFNPDSTDDCGGRSVEID
jgi:hypothetical protein